MVNQGKGCALLCPPAGSSRGRSVTFCRVAIYPAQGGLLIRNGGKTRDRTKKCLVVAVLVGLAALLMAACTPNEPSVEIVGPAQAKVNSTILLEAKATGATPLYGTISFSWDSRAGTSGAWQDIYVSRFLE